MYKIGDVVKNKENDFVIISVTDKKCTIQDIVTGERICNVLLEQLQKDYKQTFNIDLKEQHYMDLEFTHDLFIIKQLLKQQEDLKLKLRKQIQKTQNLASEMKDKFVTKGITIIPLIQYAKEKI